MMRPILINKPDLTIITPGPAATNAYLTFVIPATTVTTISITPISDPSMQVDNFNVVTKLTIEITGSNGDVPYADKIVVNGESLATTINNQSVILQGQIATGEMGSTVTVKSCGQTSTSAD